MSPAMVAMIVWQRELRRAAEIKRANRIAREFYVRPV